MDTVWYTVGRPWQVPSPLLFLIKHPLGLVGPFGLRTNHLEARPLETPGFQQIGWLPSFSGYIFGKP